MTRYVPLLSCLAILASAPLAEAVEEDTRILNPNASISVILPRQGPLEIAIPLPGVGRIAIRIQKLPAHARAIADYSLLPEGVSFGEVGDTFLLLETSTPAEARLRIEQLAPGPTRMISVSASQFCGRSCSREETATGDALFRAVHLAWAARVRAERNDMHGAARAIGAAAEQFAALKEFGNAAGAAVWWAERVPKDDLADSRDALAQALLYCRDVVPSCEAIVRMKYAANRHLAGDSLQALLHFRKALTLEEYLEPEARIQALVNIGHIYSARGRSVAGLATFRHALDLARQGSYPTQEYEVLRLLHLHAPATDHDAQLAALRFFEAELGTRVLEAVLSNRPIYDHPWTLAALGRVLASLGRYDEACEMFEKAVATGSPEVFAAVGPLYGDAQWRKGDTTGATNIYSQLLNGTYPNQEYVRYLALDHYGTNLFESKRYREAIETLREALDLGIQALASVAGHPVFSWYLESVDSTARHLAGALLASCGNDPDGCVQAEEAFSVVERIRALTLRHRLDPAVTIGRPVTEKWYREGRQRLDELAIGFETVSDPIEAISFRERLYHTLLELQDRFGSEIAGTYKMADSLRISPLRNQTAPINVVTLQRELSEEPGTAVLAYLLLPRRSYAWVVTADRLQTIALGDGVEISTSAQTLQVALKNGASSKVAALVASLSEKVSVPVGPMLVGVRKLIVVADGALRGVPFAPLLVHDRRSDVPLLVKLDLTYAPSASGIHQAPKRRLVPLDVLQRVGAHATGGLAIIADPIFQADDERLEGVNPSAPGLSLYSRLVHTEAEQAAVASHWPIAEVDRFTGERATKATLLAAELGKYRVLHFATHAVADAQRPELSRIVLARFDAMGTAYPPLLVPFEISAGMDLSAELVVLSGCETQVGANLAGEGVLSIARAFFEAGAARVVASLWPVGGHEVVELMDKFYEQLGRGCFDPISALNDAQRRVAMSVGWSRPEAWAAFAIHGSWRGCDRR